jgi:hypothetical protein
MSNTTNESYRRGKPASKSINPSRQPAFVTDPDDLPPRRGRPVQQSSEAKHVEYPRRGKPATDPTTPPRRPAPEPDNPPSHRDEPVRQPGVDYLRRSKPVAEPTAPRRQIPRDDGRDDPPQRSAPELDDLPPRRPASAPPAPRRGTTNAGFHKHRNAKLYENKNSN